MSIGTTIKRLRREKDITQEQLAEYLDISSRAISQWECDRTTPDISLLPALANIFEVSSDELLGIDVNAKQKKIGTIYKQAMSVSGNGQKDHSIAILEAGLKEYPDSYKLMELYATELYIRYVCNSSESKELRLEKGKIAAKYIDIILERCTDSEIRNKITSIACLVYNYIGRNNDALRVIDTAPEFYTKSKLHYLILKGTKRYEYLRDSILGSFTNAVSEISELADSKYDNGEPIYTDDERLALYSKVIDLFEIYFEEHDYMYYTQHLEIAHISMASIYATRNDSNNTLYHIEKAAEYAVEFDTFECSEKEYSSLLTKGTEKQGVWWEDSTNRSYNLLTQLSKENFRFLVNNERFNAIQGLLKKYVRS